uniref:Uncharacterized protein n=1 Tax=Trypanosoma congolense (strain IL3000) TaxID=1068625 RepID=G0UY89_TRYCI|nr:conserved hypothetical protein [Trypanosoma congolense IL3000]
MKSHTSESSSRTKEMQSCAGAQNNSVSIQCVTSLIRGEFLPLMQSLERDDSVVSKIYVLELALTLARLDPYLREEECRTFVHVLGSLTKTLVDALHRCTETLRLLRENLQMLRELAERCRIMDCLANHCSRNRESSPHIVKGAPALSLASSLLEVRYAPFKALLEEGTQQGTNGPVDIIPEDCGPCGVQPAHQSSANKSGNSAGCHAAMVCTDTPSDLVTGNAYNSPTTVQHPPLDASEIPGSNLTRSHQWGEELLELLTGQLSKDKTTIIVNLFESGANKSGSGSGGSGGGGFGKRQASSVVHDEPAFPGSGKSSHVEGKVNTTNGSGSISRLASHLSIADLISLRRGGHNAEDNEGTARADNGSFNADSLAPSLPSTNLAPFSRGVGKTALYLNVLADMLTSGEATTTQSLSSLLANASEGEQENAAEDPLPTASKCCERSAPADFVKHTVSVPSQRALNYLPTLFPGLRTYSQEFSGLAESTLLEEFGTNAFSSGTWCDTPNRPCAPTSRPSSFTAGANNINDSAHPGVGVSADNETTQTGEALVSTMGMNGSLCPADIVLFSLYRSLRKTDSDSSLTGAKRSADADDGGNEVKRSEASDESDCASAHEWWSGSKVTTIYRIWAELRGMANDVQSGIYAARAIQEQIQEEISFLCFRVITTVLELIVPAASSVDQRRVLFYRKWVCDLYRLLLEEGLLARFSVLTTTLTPLQGNEGGALDISSAPTVSVVTPQNRKKRTSAKALPGNATRLGSTSPGLADDVTNSTHPEGGHHEPKGEFNTFLTPGRVYSQPTFLLDKNSVRFAVGLPLGVLFSDGRPTPLQTPTVMSTPTADASQRSYGARSTPAVLMAESLLVDVPVGAPPQSVVVVTPLVATLLRGVDSANTRASVSNPERGCGVSNASFSGVSQAEPQLGTPSRITPSSRLRRQTPRRKGALPAQASGSAPKKAQLASGSGNNKAVQCQRTHHRLSYPVVTCAEDVKALYFSVLSETELTLSPLDPIRAATVQNAADFLLSVMQSPMEAFELLDLYLDDVGTEKIQMPLVKKVAINCSSELVATGHGNPAYAADSVSVSNPARRHRTQLWEPAAAGSRTSGSLRSSSGHRKRPGRGFEKDNPVVAGRFPAVPVVIPSWYSSEESAQFLTIIALLRREYDALKTTCAVESSPPWCEQEAK